MFKHGNTDAFKTYNSNLLCLHNFRLISTDDEKGKKYSKHTATTIEEEKTEMLSKIRRKLACRYLTQWLTENATLIPGL